MKSAVALLLLIVAGSLRAQDAGVTERAALLTVTGEVSWGIGINGQAVGWYFVKPHRGVNIAARLGNAGGHAYLDAYLMKRIGPEATEADEIARTSFDLAYPHDGWITLFADLDLDRGGYWLVIARPRDRAHSSINWFVARPPDMRGTCGVIYRGSQSYTFHGDAAEYLPASKFAKKFEPYAFQFEISEMRPGGMPDCP